jgi:integrase
VSFWNASLGDDEIAAVRHSSIKEAIATKQATTSGKTLNNYLIALRGVFAFAEADHLIDPTRNPTATLTNLAYQTPLPLPFDLDEVTMILAHMRERYPEQIANYFEFAFGTGMRTSELIGLKWGRIDWRRGRATVDTAMVLAEEKGTKTNRVRDVDLTAPALAALTRQKAHTFLKGADAAVFENPITGKPWADEQRQWRLYWVPTLRALGMRVREAYQTRHTYATLGLMGGVNPAYLARQLGHANTGMLFKHYARWIDGADKGAESAKMNSVFVQELSTPPRNSLQDKG